MNTQLWNLYKKSEEGQKFIEMFEIGKDGKLKDFDGFFKKLVEFDLKGVPDPPDVDKELDSIYFVTVNLDLGTFLPYRNEVASKTEKAGSGSNFMLDSYEKFVEDFELLDWDLTDEGAKLNKKKCCLPKTWFRDKASFMCKVSFALFWLKNWNGFFKPIFYQHDFSIIQKNCDAIGLELPEIPRSRDYREYMWYYFDFCAAVNDFQTEYELTDAEVCACLYGFAPMLVDEGKGVSPMPRPTNVWLTGAGKGNDDFKYLDSIEAGAPVDEKLFWACNEKTKRGDIVIVYCLTPRSYIHSIWRASGRGTFNPFDYYHCRAHICSPVLTPKITIKDLREDRYFSNHKHIRSNLQGINGKEFSAEDYAELLRLITEKGGDASKFPKLFEGGSSNFGKLELERDVEEKILIPMLKKLGYSEADWTRQLSLKAGRGLKAIPDFVFFPKGERHFECAPFVIEAKFDMASVLEQGRAFSQALSYARMLQAKLLGICDKERLLIFKAGQNGSFNRDAPIFEEHWKAIYNDELVGAKLNKLIGRSAVNEL